MADPVSKQALALDVHLDLVDDVAERARSEGWKLPYVVDTHTHADHPSGAGTLADRFHSTRIADEVRATAAPRLLLCRTGSRAATAKKTLAALHVSGLTVVDGGIEAFRNAGGGTEKGRDRMSLERQVRILAGALSLLGVGLGAFVHPGFLALAAFISAGLAFAGVTDWCGMGLLLAKAPWNQSSSENAENAAAAPAACAASAPTAGRAASVPSSGKVIT